MNIQQMMKKAQEMQKKMEEMQQQVAAKEVTGTSGGGLVSITMTGKGEVRTVKIDKSLVDPNEVEVLEDLIAAAFNNAKGDAEKIMNDEMGKLTGGLGLPPGMKLPF